MDVNFLLTAILAYLGIVAGYVIILFAKEEQKPGMKYLVPLSNVLFLACLALLLFFSYSVLNLIVAILVLLLVFSLKKARLDIVYVFYAYVLSQTDFVPAAAILIFAFGLVNGPVIADLKNNKKTLLRIGSLAYFVVLALLFSLVL